MVEVPEQVSPHDISRDEELVKEPLEAVNNVDDDSAEEEDYSGMPELCDNEHVVAAKTSEKHKDASSVKGATASLTENGDCSSSGQLGEWDDVLGSGRYGWAVGVPIHAWAWIIFRSFPRELTYPAKPPAIAIH
jgi:hypothetical protein